MGGFAWVTLATNDSYSLGALILAHSLKRVGTSGELAVLVTPGVTNSMREKLATVFNLVKEVNILDSKDEANLRLLKRPELGVTFTKLHCWRLTQYEKCVFLDADTLVLQNCDELFDREELSAAPDVGWPDCFNSGVFVYRPSNDTYEKLIQFALDKGSFDGGDQGLLNLYFSDWSHKDISKHLPFIYNMCSTACYSYLPAFKQFGGDAKIIHFIGPAKPWLQYFDSETRQVQPSGDLKHLQNVLQNWWNIFCENIHPVLTREMGGLAGAFAQLTLGAPRSAEQLELENHLRRQGWEIGNIDYLGRDSFDNIWSKICETIGESKPAEVPAEVPAKAQEEPQKPEKPKATSPASEVPTQQPTEEVVKEQVATVEAVIPEVPTTQVEPPTPGTPVETCPLNVPSTPQETCPLEKPTEIASPPPTAEAEQITECPLVPKTPVEPDIVAETPKEAKPVETPATKTPETQPLATPEVSPLPVKTAEPEVIALPEPKAAPEVCPLPVKTPEPEVLPVKTPEPEATAKVSPLPEKTPEAEVLPVKTPEPQATPKVSPLPEKTPEPVVCALPVKTPEPQAAPEVCPLPAKIPEPKTPSATPETCPLPVKTPETCPLPVKTPEVCPLPVKTPEVSPSPVKTPESQAKPELCSLPAKTPEPQPQSAPPVAEVCPIKATESAPEAKVQDSPPQTPEVSGAKTSEATPTPPPRKGSGGSKKAPKKK